MKTFARLLALVALTCFIGACTRTYVGTGDPGFPSPDADTRLVLTSHGAYGRGYGERTGKLVDVWIRRGRSSTETNLFFHRYRFVGSDVGFDAEWRSTNEVDLQVYDYGEGVSSFDARKAKAPSNHIATLSFYLDAQTGKFREIRMSGVQEFVSHLGFPPLFICFIVIAMGMVACVPWFFYRAFFKK